MSNTDKIAKIHEVFGVDVYYHISKYYGKANAKIMRGIIDSETMPILKTHKQMRDNRGLIPFAQQILINWVLEDMGAEKILRKNGYKVKRNGTDNTYQFSKQKDIKTDADFIVEKDGEEILIEMVSDFGGFWEKEQVCDLRGKKLLNLKNESKTRKVLLLALDMKNKTYGLIEITPNTYGEYRLNEKWNKSSYRIKIDTSTFSKIA